MHYKVALGVRTRSVFVGITRSIKHNKIKRKGMKEEKIQCYLRGCGEVSDFLNGVSGIFFSSSSSFLKFITSGYNIMCISA